MCFPTKNSIPIWESWALWREEERPKILEDLFKKIKANATRRFPSLSSKTTPQPLGMVVKRAKGSYIIDDKGKSTWILLLEYLPVV